jgi:hypothetical protein
MAKKVIEIPDDMTSKLAGGSNIFSAYRSSSKKEQWAA